MEKVSLWGFRIAQTLLLATYKPDLGPVNITFSDGEHVIVHDFLRAPAYKGIPPIGNFYWL